MIVWFYYNDIDFYVVEWVCNFIKKGLIFDGYVDI